MTRARTQRTETAGERLARLEALFEELPNRIGSAVVEAVKNLASSADVAALAGRVAMLETARAHADGAQTGASKKEAAAQRWIEIFSPLMWPAAIAFAGYMVGH